MSASNQTQATASGNASSAGRSGRRPNPFGPGKTSNYRERQDKQPPRGATPKESTGKAPAATAVETPVESDNNDDNTCVVCFKVVAIYSVGECDHPVCYECSTRMRVLCEQNECPICRANLSKVRRREFLMGSRVVGLYMKPFIELRSSTLSPSYKS